LRSGTHAQLKLYLFNSAFVKQRFNAAGAPLYVSQRRSWAASPAGPRHAW